jgi:cell division protein FtsQ
VQETRARTSLRRLLWVLATAVFGAILWWVVRSPMLSVSELTVAGAERAEVEDLVAEAGAGHGVPLVDIDTAAVEAVLEQDPWVAEATVVRDWPDAVHVTVVERAPAAMARAAGAMVVVAEDGVVVSDRPDPGLAVIEVPERSPESLAGDRDVVGALEFLAALPDDVAVETVARFGAEGLEAIVRGYLVRLGPAVEGPAKAAALAAILATAPEPGSVITVMSPSRPAVLPPGAAPLDEGNGGSGSGSEEGEVRGG